MQAADVAFPLQNFFYAFQWWLFGIFAVVVYVRWLWLESRGVGQ
jgi:cytochrome oxidase assembly protein ShyY1